MPILGLEGEKTQRREQSREQRREHSDERMAQRAMEREQHRAGRMDGTITELSGGPDWAPYSADPEWDGLGRRVTPASKSETTKSGTPIIRKTPVKKVSGVAMPAEIGGPLAQVMSQFGKLVGQFKAMLGIK